MLLLYFGCQTNTCLRSEELSYWPLSGSSVFCNPSEVVHWQQNLTFPEASIPTPPESECPSLELEALEMCSQFSQCSMPEDSPVISALDNGQYLQPTTDQWQGSGLPVTCQGNAALNTTTMWSASPSSVGLGPSSVLSYDSQNQDTPLSCETDAFCNVPDGLDLPYATEQTWNLPSPPVYYGPDVFSQTPGHTYATVSEHHVVPIACSMATAPTMYPGAYIPGTHVQDVPIPCQRPALTYVPVVPMRPLLPRTQETMGPSHPVSLHQQLERQMQSLHGSQCNTPCVSSTAGLFRNGTSHRATSSEMSGSTIVPSHYMINGPVCTTQTETSGSSALMTYGQTYSGVNPLVSDPTDEDFSTYIDYGHEEHSAPMGLTRSEEKS